MDNLDFLEHILVKLLFGSVNIKRDFILMQIGRTTSHIPGQDFIIIECYRKLDPTTFTDIFNDMYLKRYATALIKRQWGSANLSKFSGVEMLGGVTMNGADIYS